MKLFRLMLVTCCVLFSAGSLADQEALSAFATDGCSLFPDGSWASPNLWCDCCLAHDKIYWRGGSEEEREQADRGLEACVQKNSDNAWLASAMYVGVRLGGGPYWPTWYRWGYGWDYGRGYGSLSDAESDAAIALLQEYPKQDAAKMCE